MPIGFLKLHIRIPGCHSLKEKRGHIKPIINRLHKEFNISVSEMDKNDVWQESIIACVVISNQARQAEKILKRVLSYINKNWPDIQVINQKMEIF